MQKEIRKTVAVNYLLYLPPDYAAGNESWPLILFLHGAGERGTDIELVKKHGPPKLVAQGQQFPFVIASPQCPAGQWWESDTLVALLDTLVAENRIDTSRIYLTGLSMGGFGTWGLAIQNPQRFAAIAPICGGGIAPATSSLVKVPAWVFHGAKDRVVSVKESEAMVEALKRYGGQVRFTVYPEAQHDSWTETYANPELYEWFLSHRRIL